MKVERLIVIFVGTLIGAMVLSYSTAHGQITKIFPNAKQVGSSREIHVDDNGNIKVEGLYVEQIAGTTLFTRLYWNDVFIRINVRTDSKTQFTKRFGSSANISDVSIGDYISAEGKILGGSGSLDFQAISLKDWSLNKDDGVSYSGNISAVGTTTDLFYLNSKDGIVVLKTSPSTVVKKGALTISTNAIKRGDVILNARGTYNYLTRTLNAHSVEVHQDKSIFENKLYIGILKSMDGTTLPTAVVVTVEGKDYTVYLNSSSLVLNTRRQNVSLQRYVIGDTIRFTGNLRQTNLSEIDADVIRNISL